jgi:membrane-bound lytic murein transglycosylase B
MRAEFISDTAGCRVKCFTMLLRLWPALLLLAFLRPAFALDLPGIPQFIDEMVVKHQFKREYLEQIFEQAQHRQTVIELMSIPSSPKPWPEYRAAFMNIQRIGGGLQFWQRHAAALQRAEKVYGVPQEIIVALIGIETMYGQNTGRYNTFNVLATLAFDYPRRADFFRGQLEHYLLLVREQGWDLPAVQGSYAGALGIPQFMPGSYRNFAVDFNDDGAIDLLHDPEDAIGSVAHYLQQYGWRSGEPITTRAQVADELCDSCLSGIRSVEHWRAGRVMPEKVAASDQTARVINFTVSGGQEYWLAFYNFEVITRYNNSYFYAMAVSQLADVLRAIRY